MVRSEGLRTNVVTHTGCSTLGCYPLEAATVFAQGSGGQCSSFQERVGQTSSLDLSLTILLTFDALWPSPSVHSMRKISVQGPIG